MDLSIIIVNWNVCELLRCCLASIEAEQANMSLEVIVVDNASSDDSLPMVEREFPQVRLIASHENLGYAGGNNLGAQEAKGRYLFILNPDTEIVGDALEQMVAYLDQHPAVGAVGPQLLNRDGSVQSSCRRFPKLITAFFEGTPFSHRWFPNNRFMRAYHMADTSDDEIQSVDWLVGAALMIRREAWHTVGPLDEQFFMYFEELDWCKRCREAGWEIMYLPMSQIVHHHKGASRQVAVKTQVRLYRSKILYFRKYFGAGWANIIRLFTAMNYAWLMAEDGSKWVIGHRRELRRQKMQAHWRVIRRGLWANK